MIPQVIEIGDNLAGVLGGVLVVIFFLGFIYFLSKD